ncbi:hypothetical protein K036_4416, partial [Acinetobacter baumannii 42057_5]
PQVKLDKDYFASHLKSKKIEISIRNINENIYVVDEIFKNIFGKYINSDFIRVEVLSESLEKINNKNYYIFRFNQIFDFKNVLDLNKSTYRLDNDFLVLEKAELIYFPKIFLKISSTTYIFSFIFLILIS